MCQACQDSVAAHSLPFSRCILFVNVLGRGLHGVQIVEWSRGGAGGSIGCLVESQEVRSDVLWLGGGCWAQAGVPSDMCLVCY